jgi:hypothetical protein
VRDRQQASAGFRFVIGHPLPEIKRVRAAGWRQGRVWLHDTGFGCVVAVDDDTVQVDALLRRGPFVTDERREITGLIGTLGGLDRLCPGRRIGLRARQRCKRFGEAIAGDRLDNLDGDGDSVLSARLDAVIPATPGGVGQH